MFQLIHSILLYIAVRERAVIGGHKDGLKAFIMMAKRVVIRVWERYEWMAYTKGEVSPCTSTPSTETR